MDHFKILLLSALICAGFGALLAQQNTVNNVPRTIRECYTNITAYDRYKRQPMRIENLIAIIRKLEQKTNNQMDMRLLSRTIMKRYQFDGMEFQPHAQPEFAYRQWPLEGIKSQLIHEMIPAPDIFPEGALDNDEKCALHWMISHSMNATMRDDEEPDRYGRAYRGELRAKRASDESIHFSVSGSDGKIRRVPRAVDVRTTNRPIETGVVYTKWGPISAGRVIAGIAAGLQPQEKVVTYIPSTDGFNVNTNSGGGFPGGSGFPGGPNPNIPNAPGFGSNGGSGGSNTNGNWNWPSGRRKKRQSYGSITFNNIRNLFAATLGGDIGQATILNAPNRLESVPPPTGQFNDTVCPREFILTPLPNPTTDVHHDHDTWTYLTAAEIRGGIDGLVLGAKIRDWDRGTSGAGLRLSQILEMYYSEDGVAGDNTYRACERFQLLQGSPEAAQLKEQAKSFAYDFNLNIRKISITDETTGAFLGLVDQAYNKAWGYGSSLPTIDGGCTRRQTGSGGTTEIQDRDKVWATKYTVYGVLDHSVTDIYEMRQQQRFFAQLAYELDVSPRGSRLGLVDGGSGNIMLKPNDTDNAAIAACKIIDQPQFIRNQDLTAALRGIRTELERVRQLEQTQDWSRGVGTGIVILVLVQGAKIPDNKREEILNILNDFENNFGDVHVVYASSKYNQGDFDPFSRNQGGYDFIRIQTSQNLTDGMTAFKQEFIKRSHGRLYYPRCDDTQHDQSNEHLEPQDIFVKPGEIQFYKVSPDNFYASVDLRFRFTSEMGKVRVCVSRDEKLPSTINPGGSDCRETSGNYRPPTAGATADVEFSFVKPCKRKREGCAPIYVSITPTVVNNRPSAAQTDCSTYGCETPDQMKVTWSHYGMKCGGAGGLLISGTGFLVTAVLSLFYFFKSF